jgi:hypothetical protein
MMNIQPSVEATPQSSSQQPQNEIRLFAAIELRVEENSKAACLARDKQAGAECSP